MLAEAQLGVVRDGCLGIFGPETARYLARMQQVARSSLIGFWPLSDPSGTTAIDASLLGRDGTYSGTYTLGAEGSGDGLPAVSSTAAHAISLIAAASAWNGAEGTMAGWFRMSGSGVWTDGTNHYGIYVLADANNYAWVRKSTTNNQITVAHVGGAISKSVSLTLLTTDWFHIAWAWSATLGQTYLWLNGEPQTPPAAGLGTWAGTPTTMVIGATNTGGSSAWSGLQAHVGLWSSKLASADVALLARRRGHVIFEGDSRTQGTSSPYPTQCMALSGVAAKSYGWENIGVSGQTVAQMLSDAATQVDGQVRPGLDNVVVLWGGVNDAAAGASDETIYNRLAEYGAARKAAGRRVIVCTEIDCQSSQANAVNWSSSLRAALNTRIRNGSTAWFDTLVDLGADARLADATNTTYFNADKTHLTPTGYGVPAELVGAAL